MVSIQTTESASGNLGQNRVANADLLHLPARQDCSDKRASHATKLGLPFDRIRNGGVGAGDR